MQSQLKLVLLPGMDGTGRLFKSFVEALPPEMETVTVRYPSDDNLSYPELENVVQTACPISGPFVLLAESFSTPIAIMCAASHPEHLKGLILCAGFATSPVQSWRRFLGSLFAPLMFHVLLPKLAATLWLVGPSAPPSLLAAVRSAVSSVQPKVLVARLRTVLGCDVRTELDRVAVPILYIRAKRDHLVSVSCLEELRRIKPQLSVTELEGPHLLLQREPYKAAEVVMRFVRSL